MDFSVTVHRIFQTDGVMSDADMLALNTQMLSEWARISPQVTYSMINGSYKDTGYKVNGVTSPNASVAGALLSGGSGILTNEIVATVSWGANTSGVNWVGWTIDPTITVLLSRAATIVRLFTPDPT